MQNSANQKGLFKIILNLKKPSLRSIPLLSSLQNGAFIPSEILQSLLIPKLADNKCLPHQGEEEVGSENLGVALRFRDRQGPCSETLRIGEVGVGEHGGSHAELSC